MANNDVLPKNKNQNKPSPSPLNQTTKYDPYEYRKPEKPTTNFETFVHFVKGCLGTGLLAMPQAFSNAGYLVGLFGTIIVGVTATYCLHLLFRYLNRLAAIEEVPLLTYPEAVRVAFKNGPPCLRSLSRCAGCCVNWLLSIYHAGIMCVYVVFIASSIKQLFDIYIAVYDVRIHMAFIILPLMLIYNLRDLKQLAPVSSTANCLMFIGLIVILYYIFKDIPSLAERDLFVDIKKFPLFFGTTLFALESVGVIISLEQNMEKPKDFLGYFGVMNRATAVVLFLYTFFGFLGYWKYGNDALGSITLNIPNKDVLAQVIKVIFAVAIFFSYPLQGYVTIDILWNQNLGVKLKDHPRKRLFEIAIRCCIVICTYVAGVAIPNLGLFLSLLGAFCLTLLGIAFPALLEVCTLYPEGNYGRFNYVLIKCILLMLFAAAGLITGVSTAIYDLIIYYKKSEI